MPFITVRHGAGEEALLNLNVPTSILLAHLKLACRQPHWHALDLATEAGEVIDLWNKGVGVSPLDRTYTGGLGKGEYARKFLEARAVYVLVGINAASSNPTSQNPNAIDDDDNASTNNYIPTPTYTPLLDTIKADISKFTVSAPAKSAKQRGPGRFTSTSTISAPEDAPEPYVPSHGRQPSISRTSFATDKDTSKDSSTTNTLESKKTISKTTKKN